MFGYRLTTALGVLGLTLAATALTPATAQWFPWSSPALAHGPITAALLAFSSVLLLITTAYTQPNLAGQPGHRRFGWLMAVCGLGLLAVMAAGSPLLLAIGWTVSGWTISVLVGHTGDLPARRARTRMMRWMAASDAALWSAVLIAVASGLDLFAETPRDVATLVVAVLLLIAGVVRSALIPARGWLMGTLEAPTPVSALLHAGVVAGFGVLLVRMPVLQQVNLLIAAIGVATIAAVLVSMRHRHDEKGKLATGTSMQMGFMSLEGITGLPGLVLIHMAGHGGYKAWSFLRASGAPVRLLQRVPLPPGGTATWLAPAITASVLAAAAGFAFGWQEAMNWAVGAVSVFSALIFALRLTGRTRVILVSLSIAGFVVYALLIRIVTIAFPPIPGAELWVVLACAAALPIAAFVITRLPRNVTRRWAARANGTWQAAATSAAAPAADPEGVSALVGVATEWIQPSRPLSNFVADNPLAGLQHLDFDSAAQLSARLGVPMYGTPAQYLAWLDSGDIDVDRLADQCGSGEAARRLIADTRTAADIRPTATPDAVSPQEQLVSIASWWCAEAWHAAPTSAGCYQLWRESQTHARELPQDPATAIAAALRSLSDGDTESDLRVIQSMAMMDPGWLQVARAGGDRQVLELLALRAQLALSLGVEPTIDEVPDFPEAAIWQHALEATFRARMASTLSDHAPSSGTSTPSAPSTAIVTCIDVRSDVLRKQAEQSADVATFGMAGFFGADVQIESSGGNLDLCPVILQPGASLPDQRTVDAAWAAPQLWQAAGRGIGGLALAEGYGLLCTLAAAIDTWLPGAAHRITSRFIPPRWSGATGTHVASLDLDHRVELARRIIEIIPVDRFDDVVFVGHGSQAPNTAFASAYQCGACGGNSGHVNARLAAALINDDEVRRRLAMEGVDLGRVAAWAALHDTTVGTVELDPLQEAGAPPAVASALDSISSLPRRPRPLTPAIPANEHRRDRSTAWWQVFPEWGLAGNAACVIGPRSLTARDDLGSRVFLHDYDWRLDPEGDVLLGILSGPGVVMHMINMQYYLSVVAADVFGSGDKTRQNVLGEAGTVIGSGGRLRIGLPWQALNDKPEALGHIPVRLQVYVAAPQHVVDDAVARSPLATIVANGWLAVHAVIPDESTTITPERALSGDQSAT